jgi:hypothetical protein
MSPVVRYSESEHRETIDAWCRGWEMQPFPPHWLPEVGFIVPGVAALWVYRTDSAVLFVENVISSPDAEEAEKMAALDALCREVDAFAAARGGAYLVGQSSLPSIVELGRRHGWRLAGPPLRQIVKAVEAA